MNEPWTKWTPTGYGRSGLEYIHTTASPHPAIHATIPLHTSPGLAKPLSSVESESVWKQGFRLCWQGKADALRGTKENMLMFIFILFHPVL